MGDSTATTVTLASMLPMIGEVFEAAIGWVGVVADTIMVHPLLLVGCVLGFIGVGVGLFRRMFRM
ncbi:MAG: hypothetical protein HFF96_03530 [Oscillibacter sp.]|uniref:hypothetical protein n=1 Tax=Oscillibacter sp. TaxID=1945593 RepID=UPI002173574A|nr:hypothetical protein [Oscillibacter sp.]MCI9113324.1 hypothetical protein [Oscillibacter sp.]